VTQRYDYLPFGERVTSNGTNPITFTGREDDGVGLMYNRARYYAPGWGRFISEDPIGFGGGINQYAYCENNPLNGRDPSGLGDFADWLWARLKRLWAVKLDPTTPTLGRPYLGSPEAREINGRYPRAGRAVSRYLDQTGAEVLRQVVVGSVLKAILDFAPSWVTNERTFMGWMKQIERNKTQYTKEQVDLIVQQARGYGLKIRSVPDDLAGHPGTNWPNPHIHIGDQEFHIPVPNGYVLPP
jgi:RHS repeat-associated protein